MLPLSLSLSLSLLFFVSSALALKCYECKGTEKDCKKSTLEGNKDKYLKTYPDWLNKCGRAWIKTKSTTTVNHLCTNTFDCEVQSKNICDRLNDLDNTECAWDCCDMDACNAGSLVSSRAFLLTVCSALSLALLMHMQAADWAI